MNKDQLEHFKQRLLEEKTRLEQELNDIGDKDPSRPEHFEPKYPEGESDSVEDNSEKVTEYSNDLSIEARLEAARSDIDKALLTIENGTYGIRKYCHKDIDLKRLEARPESSSCIDCKKLLTQEM